MARARVPYFFAQIAGGFVLTVVAALSPLLRYTGLDAAADIRPSVIVASGIVLMLAGLTVVGAAQDAIDGFALTATGASSSSRPRPSASSSASWPAWRPCA